MQAPALPHRPRRFIDLRRVRWPAALAALLVLSGQAWADQDPLVTVDRLYRNGEYVTVVMRVKNPASKKVDVLRVACDVLAGDGTALGVAHARAESVPAGATVVAEAVGQMPPEDIPAKSATCRVIDGY